MAGEGRPGPAPKGKRKPFTVRFPVEHRDVYERAAADRGLALGDYITLLMAREHGLPEPDYLRPEYRDAERARRQPTHRDEPIPGMQVAS